MFGARLLMVGMREQIDRCLPTTKKNTIVSLSQSNETAVTRNAMFGESAEVA
jgi:hypothetical protein